MAYPEGMGNDNSRIRRKARFTTVSNTAVLDSSLSLKAKGLLLILLSRPDGWTFRMSWLIGQSSNGRESTRAAIRELEQGGYLVRKPVQDKNGRFTGMDWYVTDEPATGLPEAAETVGPETRPPDGLADSNNNEVTKTEKTKTKDIRETPPISPPIENEAVAKADPSPATELAEASPSSSGALAAARGGNSRAAPVETVDNLPDWIPPELWAEWEQLRREKRKPLTPTARRRQLRDLERWRQKYGVEAALEAIETSIRNDWQGLFEPKVRRQDRRDSYQDRVSALLGGA